MKKTTIFLLLCVFALSATHVKAQKFSTLPENERNEKLIKLARYIYQNPRFANFYNTYKEYGTPTVTSFKIDEEKAKTSRESAGRDVGPLAYVVYFYYDKSKYTLDWDYAARIYISDKQGKAFSIYFGTNIGYIDIWDLDKGFKP